MDINVVTKIGVLFVCLYVVAAQGRVGPSGLGMIRRSGPECKVPLDTGICNLNITRYYYDINTKSCRPFAFRGCGGNLNNYATLTDCNMRCVCTRRMRVGNGGEDLMRYYYNFESGRCEQFSFSGNGGNANRFRSVEECSQTCVIDDDRSPRRCERMPDYGTNCGNSTIRYYYDKNCDCCREFTYLGCGGNNNRFENEAVCKKKCAGIGGNIPATTAAPTPNPNSRPSMCYALPTKGPCSQSVARYYFDASSGSCKTFTYSGCGGNGNNFMIPTDCVNVCKASSDLPTTTAKPMPTQCTLPLKRGNCSRIMLRFYYNKSTSSCRMFLYSGCGGNSNNFLTYMDCIGTCNATTI